MNKKFIVTTALFLLVSLAVGFYGFYVSKHSLFVSKFDDLTFEFKKDGALYFYDGKKLLGSYTCIDFNVCDYASFEIDDDTTNIDYYKNDGQTKVINDKYVFIKDGNYQLFDLIKNEVVATYKSVKNYGIGIEEDKFIVCDGLCGVIKLGNGFKVEIPLNYEFVGLIDNQRDNKLIADRYVIKKDNKWSILDNNNQIISNDFDEGIVTYSGKYIITKTDNKYKLYDFDGTNLLENVEYNYLSFTENYVNIINQENKLYVYDVENDKIITDKYIIVGNNYKESFSSKLIENNKLKLIINDEQQSTHNFDL